MSNADVLIDLQVKIRDLMSLKYDVSAIDRVPTKQDVTFGDKACSIQAACLFIDIRDSSKLIQKYRVSDVANLLKCFHYICSFTIRKNTGEVRSFNGDSVLAIFTEKSCCDCAASTAFNIKYFIDLLLISKYKIEKDLDFGIGIDFGKIFVVKVGNRGEFNNDLVWIGSPVNRAAKMGNKSNSPNSISISKAVYERLNKENRFLPPKRTIDHTLLQAFGIRPEIWHKTLSPIPIVNEPINYYSSYKRGI